MALTLSYSSVLPAAATVLGGSVLGVASSVVGPSASGLRPDWPCQPIPLPLLGQADAVLHECWLSDQPLSAGVSHGIHWRRSPEMLFGVLTLDEAEWQTDNDAPLLQAAGESVYRRIFALLHEAGMPYLWRVWNYIAEINQESCGLERYRQFNIGRQKAFQACVGSDTLNVPAACALGIQGKGPLSIAFMAGAQAPVPIENPRQVSAYYYPSQYGPSSPTFSRAVLLYPKGQEILSISGTASIVGHETLHQGNVAEQSRESMRNIEAVVASANHKARSRPFSTDELHYRVYLRRREDLPLIQAALAPWLTPSPTVHYVLADVCRGDLLMELEAVALHSLESV
jgi:enamine deaminase RidA (YjgF/YER057c/UK114 family)